MEITNYYNLISVIVGLTMIVACSSIAFYFQKNLFSKYRNKISNIVDKKPDDES